MLIVIFVFQYRLIRMMEDLGQGHKKRVHH